MSIFHNLYKGLQDACYIWRKEMTQVVKDEGVLIFFVFVPLVYPLLYSWIYNNEVVREVPVCVVDQSHSHLSREFIRMCDASPDVHVKYYAQDLMRRNHWSADSSSRESILSPAVSPRMCMD